MHYHTVLFQFAEDTPEDTIDHVLARHRELGSIPAVKSVVVGRNMMPVTDGWTYGMTMVFDSYKSMMEEFADDPLHQAVFEEVRSVFSRFMAMDLEDAP